MPIGRRAAPAYEGETEAPKTEVCLGHTGPEFEPKPAWEAPILSQAKHPFSDMRGTRCVSGFGFGFYFAIFA